MKPPNGVGGGDTRDCVAVVTVSPPAGACSGGPPQAPNRPTADIHSTALRTAVPRFIASAFIQGGRDVRPGE
ncbi:hypothetical protein KH5H1_72160 [Corallococcus caeni]|uniref:Uncharacterized protein n=1 Tax=Corallococcus caeni TaxID=3082388 RepID=A0ABQ6R5G2_9BACT|nr:hypothetical protein KH5H1_72160 [Corallococcus sp. KH5-1]GMU11301.1 hypothetical protein ASNO1_75550 [Corallococcus sp. NO1]